MTHASRPQRNLEYICSHCRMKSDQTVSYDYESLRLSVPLSAWRLERRVWGHRACLLTLTQRWSYQTLTLGSVLRREQICSADPKKTAVLCYSVDSKVKQTVLDVSQLHLSYYLPTVLPWTAVCVHTHEHRCMHFTGYRLKIKCKKLLQLNNVSV